MICSVEHRFPPVLGLLSPIPTSLTPGVITFGILRQTT